MFPGRGVEPRTPDLQVRCPTDCATQPGNSSCKNAIPNSGNDVEIVPLQFIPYFKLCHIKR